MPSVFGIADDNLVVGYEDDSRDHDDIVQKVLQRCRMVNLKLNRDKGHSRCTSVPFIEKVISRNWVQPGPQKLRPLWRCHPQQ